MDPQQEIFSALLIALNEKYKNTGIGVYDTFLPPEGTAYPFVYLGATTQSDQDTKDAIIGKVSQTVHVWHDNLRRKEMQGLQVFSESNTEAVQGKKIIYLYRLLKEAATESAKGIAFTTENGRTKSKDADTTATKDGTIRTPGALEVEITATSILAKGDTTIDKLEEALDNDELLEIWEVNLLEKGTSSDAEKFKAKYFQGYLTELEYTSNAEDNVEVSLTFGCNGKGEAGYATVTKEQQELANYVFADTQKTGP